MFNELKAVMIFGAGLIIGSQANPFIGAGILVVALTLCAIDRISKV